MITTTLVCDHSGRAKNKYDKGTIEVRVTVNRRSYYINTGIRVIKKEWLNGKITKRPDWSILKERILIIQKNIEKEVNQCIESGIPIIAADIKRRAWNNIDSGQNMLEWFAEQIDQMKVAKGTKAHYKVMLRRLEEFGKMTRWKDLTVENICIWDAYLHDIDNMNVNGAVGGKLSDAAVYNYHKCFKSLINQAELYEKIDNNPYKKIRGKFSRGECSKIKYLTENELKKIEKIKPLDGSQMAIVRDLFIFQVYTGMAYADTQEFDIQRYSYADGCWTSIGKRVKTKVEYVSLLLPPVVEILEKYDMKTPKMANQRYNYLLKVLGEVAGIDKRLTSHMARHTFATLMLKNNVKIEHVSKMLGHTNIVQTQQYAKVISQEVYNDYKMISKKLNLKNKVQ